MRKDEKKMPSGYGLDYVALIPRSPSSLFVYWDLSGPRSEYYRKNNTGEIAWCLSLINLDAGGEVNWKSLVPIEPDSGNHYLKVQPDNRYRVELGVRIGDTFHPVCHSRERTTPRDTPPQGGARPGPEASKHQHRPREHAGRAMQPAAEVETPSGLIWREGMQRDLPSS